MRALVAAMLLVAPAAAQQVEPKPAASNRITADDYPPAAMRAGEEGEVEYSYLVGVDGSVTDCAISRSSGSARLDERTCQLIMRRWRFAPALKDGKPVAMRRAGSHRWALSPIAQ